VHFFIPLFWNEKLSLLTHYNSKIVDTFEWKVDFIDQSDYQKYGPNLQKIATELKPFDLAPYTYWLEHVKNLEKSKHGKYLKNTKIHN